MSEDTQSGQPPMETPDTQSPSNIDAAGESDSLASLRTSLRNDKIAEIKAEFGEERFLAVVDTVEQIFHEKATSKFSEADKRNYKDLDAVAKTLAEQRAEITRLQGQRNGDASSEQVTDNGSQNASKAVESSDTSTDESQEAVLPNGAVSRAEFNQFQMESITREHPEFVHVAEQVEKVANASNANVKDVWEGKNEFATYGFKMQAQFKDSEAKKANSKQQNKVMPSFGGNVGQNSHQRVSGKQFIEDIKDMSAAEITAAVKSGRVG